MRINCGSCESEIERKRGREGESSFILSLGATSDMRQHRDGSQSIAMPYPRFLRMIESVCQPLLLQKLIPVLAKVQGLATF